MGGFKIVGWGLECWEGVRLYTHACHDDMLIGGMPLYMLPSTLPSPPSSPPCLQERQKALEDMGISVQAAGIGVQSDKHYLVNLNADPSMNELLVCYLKVCVCVCVHVCACACVHKYCMYVRTYMYFT